MSQDGGQTWQFWDRSWIGIISPARFVAAHPPGEQIASVEMGQTQASVPWVKPARAGRQLEIAKWKRGYRSIFRDGFGSGDSRRDRQARR